MKNNYKPKPEGVTIFLKESNAIEGIYDDDSLKQAEIAWKYLAKQENLTLSVILHTHKLLMLNQTTLPGFEKGYLRRCNVRVGMRSCPDYTLIPDKIALWIEWVNKKKTDPIQAHVEYEHIHPFVDGNGRTGRMFMNWMRIQRKEPIMVVFERDKYDYYQWFT